MHATDTASLFPPVAGSCSCASMDKQSREHVNTSSRLYMCQHCCMGSKLAHCAGLPSTTICHHTYTKHKTGTLQQTHATVATKVAAHTLHMVCSCLDSSAPCKMSPHHMQYGLHVWVQQLHRFCTNTIFFGCANIDAVFVEPRRV